MTCMAMLRSGQLTDLENILRHQSQTRRARAGDRSAFFAAAHGTATKTVVALLLAAETILAFAEKMLVSAW